MDPGSLDVRFAIVAEEKRHEAPPNDDRDHDDSGTARALEIVKQHRVESRRVGDGKDRQEERAGRREDRRRVERDAQARHCVSRSPFSRRVAALGQISVDHEDRGELEELSRELENEVEDGVARVRLVHFFLRDRKRKRTTSPLADAAVGAGVARDERCREPGGSDGRQRVGRGGGHRGRGRLRGRIEQDRGGRNGDGDWL